MILNTNMSMSMSMPTAMQMTREPYSLPAAPSDVDIIPIGSYAKILSELVLRNPFMNIPPILTRSILDLVEGPPLLGSSSRPIYLLSIPTGIVLQSHISPLLNGCLAYTTLEDISGAKTYYRPNVEYQLVGTLKRRADEELWYIDPYVVEAPLGKLYCKQPIKTEVLNNVVKITISEKVTLNYMYRFGETFSTAVARDYARKIRNLPASKLVDAERLKTFDTLPADSIYYLSTMLTLTKGQPRRSHPELPACNALLETCYDTLVLILRLGLMLETLSEKSSGGTFLHLLSTGLITVPTIDTLILKGRWTHLQVLIMYLRRVNPGSEDMVLYGLLRHGKLETISTALLRRLYSASRNKNLRRLVRYTLGPNSHLVEGLVLTPSPLRIVNGP